MAQLGFYFDSTHCIGCRTCHIACKDKNNLGVGPVFRHVFTFEGGKFPQPWAYHLSMACNHCSDPACVNNCPTGAMHKDANTGIVSVDEGKCVGCRYCMWWCPYDAVSFIEEEGKVGKCDFCSDLLAEGKDPACVAACVMRVLKYGDLDKLRAEYGETCDMVGLPDSSMTKPSLVVTPKPVAVAKT